MLVSIFQINSYLSKHKMCQNGQFSKSVWLKLVLSINSRVLSNWVAIDHLLRKMQKDGLLQAGK